MGTCHQAHLRRVLRQIGPDDRVFGFIGQTPQRPLHDEGTRKAGTLGHHGIGHEQDGIRREHLARTRQRIEPFVDFFQALEVLGFEPETLAVAFQDNFQRRRAAEFAVDDGHALIDLRRFTEVVDETVLDFYKRVAIGTKNEQGDRKNVDKFAMAFGEGREDLERRFLEFGESGGRHFPLREEHEPRGEEDKAKRERDGDAGGHDDAEIHDGPDTADDERAETDHRRHGGVKTGNGDVARGL